MNCWFWNIDRSSLQYLSDELQQSRLRQGWGYEERLDLRMLHKKVQAMQKLDEAEQQAWDRCHAMLNYIKVGDLIVVKNIPTPEHFTLVRVTGNYEFSIDSPFGDYGHILPIETLNEFLKISSLVSAPFANALNREQYPIRITYKHQQAVRDLESIPTTSKEKNKPEPLKEKMTKWRERLIPHLKEELQKDLSPKETERLIGVMLRKNILGEIQWSAGPNERGADFLGEVPLGYGFMSKLAIQVKMHWGTDHDSTGIEQLVQAFEVHGIQAGLLVTTADQLGDQLKQRLEEAEKKYNIRILYGNELFGYLLEVIADPSADSSQKADI